MGKICYPADGFNLFTGNQTSVAHQIRSNAYANKAELLTAIAIGPLEFAWYEPVPGHRGRRETPVTRRAIVVGMSVPGSGLV